MKPERFMVYLDDIADAARSIKDHTRSINKYEDFISNRLVYRAVERELEIIAEALKRAQELKPDFELKHAAQIKGLRNRVVHDYANTNYDIIWGVVVKHIDELIIEVEDTIRKI
jgi:uncharacterized protein with HEPN domain